MVEDHLPAVLPLLYEQTSPEAAIHTFDMGLIKKHVDGGVELRKVAARLPCACACSVVREEGRVGAFFP
jgi:hypothetical protein